MSEADKNLEVEKYLQTLSKAGFRLTNQRRTIIVTLLENIGNHPDAQELLEMVQKEDPSIGIATVYRTVEILNQMDLLNLSHKEERLRRYEIADGRMHIHYYCRCCGKVIHLKDEQEKSSKLRQWAKEENFTILPQTFELSGICEECRTETSGLNSKGDIYINCRNKCQQDISPPPGSGMGRRRRGRRCLNPEIKKDK